MKAKNSGLHALSLAVAAMIVTLNAQLSTCFAQSISYTNWDDLVTNWVQTSAPGTNWSSLVGSANGMKLAAIINGGSAIATSTNAGATWTQRNFAVTVSWCSADGTKLLQDWGTISTNGGATWIQGNPPQGPIYCPGTLAVSSEGSTMALGESCSPCDFHYSTNFGMSWSVLTYAIHGEHITISADGTKIGSVDNGGTMGIILTSADSGATWHFVYGTLPSPPGGYGYYWSSFAFSTDQTKLVVCCSYGIWTSTNSGATWSQTSAPNLNWNRLVSSADGATLAASAADGGIFVSTNSGASWIQTTAPGNNWHSLVMSEDGMKLAAISTNGIWTAHVRVMPYIPPALGISPAGSQSILYWPAWASDYVLECSSDLSGTNWTMVTNGAAVIAVTLTNAPPAQYFRLRQY